MGMKVTPIKTRPLNPPQDDVFEVIKESIKNVPEKSVLVVTSKVVSIHQGRCIPMDEVLDKDALIHQEADKYLPREMVPHEWVVLTIKDHTLIPTAGIDESNADNHFILMPHNSDDFAQKIWEFVRKEFSVNELGIIISDSRTVPLRWGVVGISLGFYGFDPLNDYRGTADIFGRQMKVSMANVVDSLSAAAVYAMGEGKETQPFVLIEDIPQIKFGENKAHRDLLKVESDEDLFAPVINAVNWKLGGGGNQ